MVNDGTPGEWTEIEKQLEGRNLGMEYMPTWSDRYLCQDVGKLFWTQTYSCETVSNTVFLQDTIESPTGRT